MVANCTRNITPDEVLFFSCMKEHYELRVAALPKVRWLRDHYRYLCRVVNSGVVHSIE